MIAFHQKLMLRPLLSFPHFNKQLIQMWVQVDAKTLIVTFHHNRVVLNLTSLKQHYVISFLIPSLIQSSENVLRHQKAKKKQKVPTDLPSHVQIYLMFQMRSVGYSSFNKSRHCGIAVHCSVKPILPKARPWGIFSFHRCALPYHTLGGSTSSVTSGSHLINAGLLLVLLANTSIPLP